MRAPWRRAAAIAAATPCLAASLSLGFLGGCENPADQADKDMQQKVQTDQQKIDTDEQKLTATQRQDGKVAHYEAVRAALMANAKLPNVSDRSKVEVNRRLAQAEVNAADQLMHDVSLKEIEASRLIGDIQGLTAQIKANNVTIAGYEAMKPDATLQLIEQNKQAVTKGDSNGQWVAGEVGTIPSETSVQADVDKLNEQIKALTDKKTGLEDQRSKTATEADGLVEQAHKAKGPPALDMTTKAAELHKQARQTAWEIEQADGALSRLQQDLRVATARQKVYAEAVKALDDRAAKVNEQWKDVQEQQKTLAEQSDRLLGKPGSGAPATEAPPAASAPDANGQPKQVPLTPAEIEVITGRNNITAKAGQIKQLVTDADAGRAKALELYGSAVGHTKTAADAAAKAVIELKRNISAHHDVPELAAWKSLVEIFGPSEFDLQTASIDAKIAQAHADHAIGLVLRDQARQQLATVVQNAKPAMNMPEAMGFAPATEADGIRAAANEAFKTSEGLVRKVAGVSEDPDNASASSDADIARLAKVALINTLYNHAQFQQHFADPQATTMMATAQKYLKDIESDFQSRNQALPYFASDLMESAGIKHAATQPFELPGEAGSAPAATAPATEPGTTQPATKPDIFSEPGTTPATGPATAPADGAPASPPAPPPAEGTTPTPAAPPPAEGTTPAPATVPAEPAPGAPAPAAEPAPGAPPPAAPDAAAPPATAPAPENK